MINSIVIQDKNGVIKTNAFKGKVVLKGGADITVDTDGNDCVISMDKGKGDNPYYAQKYKAATEGGHYPDEEPYEYSFTGFPYWINSIQRAIGIQGNTFLLGSGGIQIGNFGATNPSTPSSFNTYPDAIHTLSVNNLSAPDVDCQDYSDFYTYLNTVSSALTTQKNNIEDTPKADANNGFGVFDQYISLLTYWNYLVSKLEVKVSIERKAGSFPCIKIRYSNFKVNRTSPYPYIDYTNVPHVSNSNSIVYPKAVAYTVDDVLKRVQLSDTLKANTGWYTYLYIDAADGTTIDWSITINNIGIPITRSGSFVI